MPESYGKRQRNTAHAKKVAAREERRLERKQRDADRAAGLIEAGTPIAPNEPDEFEAQPSSPESDEETTSQETEGDEAKPDEKRSEDSP